MEIDFRVEVDHRWIYERPYKVTLTRGAGGQYRWEIEVRDVIPIEVLDALVRMDEELRNKYGGLEPPEEEG